MKIKKTIFEFEEKNRYKIKGDASAVDKKLFLKSINDKYDGSFDLAKAKRILNKSFKERKKYYTIKSRINNFIDKDLNNARQRTYHEKHKNEPEYKAMKSENARKWFLNKNGK